jgi:hypothetical protein
MHIVEEKIKRPGISQVIGLSVFELGWLPGVRVSEPLILSCNYFFLKYIKEKLNFFFIFSDYFGMLILKIIFKNKIKILF